MRKALTLAALTLGAIALIGTPALAFHDDGVAHCNGCHTMHNSQDGAAMNFQADGTPGGTAVGTGFTNLLLFVNKNDVCLRCHNGNNSYHVWSSNGVLDPGQEHGAGNFVFLEEDNLNDGHGGASGTCTVATCDVTDDQPCTNETDCLAETGGVWTWSNAIPGMSAGHTLASGLNGTGVDTILTSAPGGSFLNTDLHCGSCHDPHGTDAYRILYKAGQTMAVDSGGTFTWPAGATIVADEMGLFGPFANEGNANHNSYKSGYSEWCAACHTDFHNGFGTNLIHPSGTFLTADEIASYNKYEGTADCVANGPAGGNPCGSGLVADAYLAAVPFEDANATGTSQITGATATSKVACVTCHRAHASSAPDAGRWDFNVTLVEEDGHESGSYKIPNPYPTDLAQRSLCNKCHSQDEFDDPITFP